MRDLRRSVSILSRAIPRMSHPFAPASSPSTSRRASEESPTEKEESEPEILLQTPTRPERAHLRHRNDTSTTEKKLERDLSNAMASPLFAIGATESLTSSTDMKADLIAQIANVSKPASIVHAPKKIRPGQNMKRQRSLSTGSLYTPDADPFAWLRQTVQEQREHPLDASHPNQDIHNSSVPASPTISSFQTEAGNSSIMRPDYFGASLLSLIAGKESVQKRLHEQIQPNSNVGVADLASLSKPNLPSFQPPSIPKWQPPSMPIWKAPSMPRFNAPTLPQFKAPNLPSVSSWMPEAFTTRGGHAGEEENKKYMDEADQTEGSEPDWGRIKVRQVMISGS